MERETGREGELFLPFDPGQAGDATLAFIGHLETPWRKGDCPRNLTEARARGGRFVVHLDPAYRAGLEGLSAGMAVYGLSSVLFVRLTPWGVEKA